MATARHYWHEAAGASRAMLDTAMHRASPAGYASYGTREWLLADVPRCDWSSVLHQTPHHNRLSDEAMANMTAADIRRFWSYVAPADPTDTQAIVDIAAARDASLARHATK